MALSSSNAARQLSDGNSVGTLLGQSTSDVIGFYSNASTAGVNQYQFSSGVGQQSISSGALASSLAAALHRLGLIQCSTILP